MKPLAFNLKDAKKVAGDKHSSTFELKGGHQIKVAHAPLPALQRKQVEKMPVHLADGGSDDDSGPDNASANSSSAPAQAPAYLAPNPPGSDQQMDQSSVAPEGSGEDPSATDDQQDPDQASSPTANSPAMGGADINGAYQQGQQAISEQQNVAQQLAQKNSDIQQKYISDKQDLQDGATRTFQDFSDHQQQVLQDYMNNKIDPKAYIENMSSGQKVSTAIGLFLGGFGSAFTHQGNPALDFLNKQIDRDIDAQKARQGQQKTLLEANQNLYHDNVLAENATRVNLNDITDHKIQLAAAQLGTPQAKAAADAAHSEFALKNSQLLYQNSIRATAMHAIQSGNSAVDPMMLGQAGLMPMEQAQKEQAAWNAKKASIDSADKAYDNAGEQTVVQKLNPLNWHTGAELGVDQSVLKNNLMAVAPSKRYSPDAAENLVKPFVPSRGDNAAEIAIKRQGYKDLIDRESAGETPYSSRILGSKSAPYVQPVERLTTDGKVGLFNPVTKAFIRYK